MAMNLFTSVAALHRGWYPLAIFVASVTLACMLLIEFLLPESRS
jgi:hypothetical protein